MRVRAIDSDGNWEYGKGANNYKRDKDALAQNLTTRIRSFLANCFFDAGAGIDWFTYVGGKDPIALQLAISAIIINTSGIIGIIDVLVDLDAARNFTVSYDVNSIYGRITSDAITVNTSNVLTTEDGDVLTTEDGQGILT